MEGMFQRHLLQAGETMFITSVTKKRAPIFRDAAVARIAVETLYQIQQQYSFFLFAFVIMPDHCHLLLLVPDGGSISKIMNVYKRATSFNIGRGPIWQSRFHMRTPNNVYGALRYIHNNPVVARMCDDPEKYPWSSASGRWDVTEVEW